MKRVTRVTFRPKLWARTAAAANAEEVSPYEFIRRSVAEGCDRREQAKKGRKAGLAEPPAGLEERKPTTYQEGEVIFAKAGASYGRALVLLKAAPGGVREKVEVELDILGEGTSLLRELLDERESLRKTCCRLRARSKPISPPANDNEPQGVPTRAK